MRYVLLLLATAALSSGQTFSVIHKRTLWRDVRGTVQITDNAIVYRADKKKDSRIWHYPDIQYFDRISDTEFVILTYEDRRLELGRDRQFDFVITKGNLTDSAFDSIRARLRKPATNRVVGNVQGVLYSVPVKHLHTLGGCQGTLEFTKNEIYYKTGRKKDAREWRINKDIQSVWSMDPYELEIHAYDNNRREFSRTRVYKFELKLPLDAAFYRKLKLRLYGLQNPHVPME